MTTTSSPADSRSARDADADPVAALRAQIVEKLIYSVGKDVQHAQPRDWFVATALAARDQVVDKWIESTRRTYREGRKRVYYLSLEFLIGRLLFDTLGNLGLIDTARAALSELGVDLDTLRRLEPDPGLGNGGLGRLAACYMESMATLAIPSHGYGIRYDHGIFRQSLQDGWQMELPEDWLSAGNPWEFRRPEVAYVIGFGGRVDQITEPDGTVRSVWHPAESVKALAYDTPITGWRGAAVNTLRLWSARAMDPSRSTSSTRATTSARSRTAYATKRSRACSTRATRHRPATSYGCGRRSSSRRRRFRTSCADTRHATATC